MAHATVAFTDLEGFAGTSFPNVSGFEVRTTLPVNDVVQRNRVIHILGVIVFAEGVAGSK